jgi:hypothetical protein
VPAVVWGPDSSRFQIVPAQSLSSAGTQYAMYRKLDVANFDVKSRLGQNFGCNRRPTEYGSGQIKAFSLARMTRSGS